MKGLLAGLGVVRALEPGAGGSVVASFREACYADIGGMRVALVAPGVHPGPMHLLLDSPPPRPEPGRPVSVGDDGLSVDGAWIDLSGVATWRGRLPRPAEVREHAPTIAEAAERGSIGSALRQAPYVSAAIDSRALLRTGRLEEAAERLAGLGPGLTPAGDDALCGIVFALRAAFGSRIQPRAMRAIDGARAGPFGLDALRHAARGQTLAPIHDLMSAGVDGDPGAASAAARSIAAVGETSGADLLAGISWALSEAVLYAVAASLEAPSEPAASAR